MTDTTFSRITATVAIGLFVCCAGTVFANPGDPAPDGAPAVGLPMAEPAVEPAAPLVMAQASEGFDPTDPGGPRDGDPRSSCSGDITLGSGTSTTSSYPLSANNSTSPYNRTMSLIRRSEITSCTPYRITQIAVYISTAAGASMNFDTVEIRMKKVTLTAFASSNQAWIGDGTLVWSQSSGLGMRPTGWKTFVLTTPFIWDSDNLLITWQGHGVGGGTSTCPFYYQTVDLGWKCQCGANSTSWPTTFPSPYQTRAQYILTFEPTTTGACCVSGACTADVTEDYCVNTLGGIFQETGSVCSSNPCFGACCYGYPDYPVQCTNTDSETCKLAYGGTWHANTDCATYYCPPWNNFCADVTPRTLTAGVTETWTGDTRGSTDNCSVFAGNESWLAYTLTNAYSYWDVVLDYCGTTPAFGTCWLNRTTPTCCGSLSGAAIVDYWPTCGDGNLTIRWSGSGAATNYYPIKMDPALAFGPYTIHILARPGYAASNATNTAEETIKNVTLVGDTPPGINNTTADCDTYNNFRDLPAANLTPGMTYDFSLTIGDCEGSGCHTKRAVIWIDWNQNFSFADANEQAWYSGATILPDTPCPDMTVTGSITVPANATLGMTRMRVIVVEAATGVPAATGSYTYGATEDYTINVGTPIGACCNAATGDCTITTQAACSFTWHGAGTVCDQQTCPQPDGSCCFHDGTCAVMKQADCTGAWTMGGLCDPNTCVPPDGSCCYHDGTCAVTKLADCSGTWTMDGVCDPNTCVPPDGSCCHDDGTCAVTKQADCTGTWTMDGVCDPNSCPQPCLLMGDLNHDTYVDGLDVQCFVDCVLAGGLGCPCGNFDDSNLVVDLDDLGGFVAALLAP